MAEIYASSMVDESRSLPNQRVVLNSGACYWFLYRYFEAANLPPRQHELIGLYDDGEISGYQLERLVEELEEAKADVEKKPEHFSVLTGWDGGSVAKASEIRQNLERKELLALIDALLSLGREALAINGKLILIGD
jgi:hypothetical protein